MIEAAVFVILVFSDLASLAAATDQSHRDFQQSPTESLSEEFSHVLPSSMDQMISVVGIGSAIGSSLISSITTATRATRLPIVAEAVECSLVYWGVHPNRSNESPAYAPTGDGKSGALGASPMMLSVSLAFPFLVLVLVGIGSRHSPPRSVLRLLQANVIAKVCFIALECIAPHVVYLSGKRSVLVASRQGTAEEVLAVQGSCFFVLFLLGSTFFVLNQQFEWFFRVVKFETILPCRTDPSLRVGFENRHAHSMALESFGALFDAARSEALNVRLYYMEEVFVSMALHTFAVFSPKDGGCGFEMGMMTFVAVLHLWYLGTVRPYADWLELFFSVLSAVLLLTLTLIGFGSRIVGHLPGIRTALGVILLIQNVLFFVQFGVMAVAALMRMHRQRLGRQWRFANPTDAELPDSASVDERRSPQARDGESPLG